MSRGGAPRPLLLAGLLLAAAGSGSGAAPAGLIDIPGETPLCAKAEDRIACLSALAERSAAQVRAALGRARAALKRSATIPDSDRAAALDALERTQGAWRAYVRRRCEGEVPVAFTGGTGRSQAVLTCLRVHDERRTAELSDLAGMN